MKILTDAGLEVTQKKMTPEELESGYWRSYRDFYKWTNIFRGARVKEEWSGRLRHLAYATGWKKFEPLWDWVIRAKQVGNLLPALENVLSGFGKHPEAREERVRQKLMTV